MSIICPIEQWRDGVRLIDPTGAPYDPNLPPAIIAHDSTLRAAIEFGRENPSRLGVTVLCGLQTETADLGTPGEFEQHMAAADMYGSGRFGQPQPLGTESYAHRVERAMISYARPTLMPFNTMDDLASTAYQNLAAIRKAIDDSVGGFEVMQQLDMGSLGIDNRAPEEVGLNAFAGEVHFLNHLNWIKVASVCRRVAQLHRSDRAQVLIDEGVTGFSLYRNFDLLGIQAKLHELNRDAWPQEVIDEVLDFGSAVTTGRLPD